MGPRHELKKEKYKKDDTVISDTSSEGKPFVFRQEAVVAVLKPTTETSAGETAGGLVISNLETTVIKPGVASTSKSTPYRKQPTSEVSPRVSAEKNADSQKPT